VFEKSVLITVSFHLVFFCSSI